MRIVLVGSDLAPVRPGAGALETLLCGWAGDLVGDGHEVTVLSVPAPPSVSATAWQTGTFGRPSEIRRLLGGIRPDVVMLNNRPGWQRFVDAPTVHLAHNWPDAWGLPEGVDAGDVIGDAAVAAVSQALAATVAGSTGRSQRDVPVVRPFVAPAFSTVEPQPEPGLVVSPNRLMVKKGVAELAAAADHPAMLSYRVLITDHLSPWTTPTADHVALRAVVAASRAELVPPPPGVAGMAALYARADVVVCPSIRPEGLGLTAVEAQTAGVPVVSSGLGGLAEAMLLPELVADPRDPVALAAAITAAAGLGPGARRDLRARAAATWSRANSLRSLLPALEGARPARAVASTARDRR